MLKRFMFGITIPSAVVAVSLGSFAGAGATGALPAAVHAQTEHAHDSQASPPSSPTQASPTGMAEMMKMHEQHMAEMKAADARLDELVREMNSATGEAKISALTQVVTELVRQQKAMHDQMGTMGRQMMMQMMSDGRGMMKK
jgi:vancomycin resistance protein YoaR